jgi:gamma-glutamyltranspeptidase/glutathione hydrolase
MSMHWWQLQGPSDARVGVGTKGMVATVHPAATDAAVRVMKDGGNAIDAAVVAAFMLGVVDGFNSGIGGGCFALARLANGNIVAMDGREMAPMKATRDMFLREGKADTSLSQTGTLAAGVPGSVAVYEALVRRHGRKKLGELILPAAEVAEKGFTVTETYAERLKLTAKDLARFEGSRRVLLKENGEPHVKGEVLKQPDLARSYRAIAREGAGWFYKGVFARATADLMRGNGGIITEEDFARYVLKEREPLVTRYREYTVVGFPPPSSGGVHVAQILSMLERFDLPMLEANDRAGRAHVMAEAMKLAFADRAHWLGDPDFVKVPKGLVDREYLASLAERIDPEKVTKVEGHGTPADHAANAFGDKHTTHIAAADAEGNWVAITTTVNTTFGSKVIVPGTGVVLNNQMDDFSAQPGVRNYFGLVGSEANAIAPGKRPLSSMSPTIVMREGKPVMTLGAAGGPTIITQVVLAITNHLDLGDDLPTAVARPRLHHQWSPDVLYIERAMDQGVVNALKERGHVVELTEPRGATQAIGVGGDFRFVGVAEPRGSGKSMGI